MTDRRSPPRTRLGLVLANTRRRIRPRSEYAIPLGPGRVLLSHDDYEIDRKTLQFVVRDGAWAGDYADAVVLDVGAHKGYFGAYALAHGARAVVSFEPEAVNVSFLERTAETYRSRGADWSVRPVAIGATTGEAELHVMAGSWGHALDPPDSFAEYEVGVERVPVEAMADVLAVAAPAAGDARVVVKLNIEGAECDTVLGTPPAAWHGVAEVLVETHPWASCDADDLATHLEPAGLTRAASGHRLVLRLRRAAGPRSRSRTAPS